MRHCDDFGHHQDYRAMPAGKNLTCGMDWHQAFRSVEATERTLEQQPV